MSERRFVVTLPPAQDDDEARAFAARAKAAGADLLEVRTDLHGDARDVAALARTLPVLVSQRGRALPASWLEVAAVADVEVGDAPVSASPRPLLSLHASQPLSPGAALERWRALAVPAGAVVKHVEPLGGLRDGARLLQTQRLLSQHFGPRVVVLATGPCALPFRAVLAEGNALDYVALDAGFAAAPGQRLLADAVQGRRAKSRASRLGILGSGIAGSRSPRIHPQPFDRIDLPAEADVGALVEALTPWYRGFAVTSPFKRKVAFWLGGGDEAVNTLYRVGAHWRGANTDVAGARATLEALGAREVTLLGGGGVAPAVLTAASELDVRVRVLRREEATGVTLAGAVIWSWPAGITAQGLGFLDAKVAVIAYGANGRKVASQVRALGGQPRMLGPRWFISQARAQRELWQGGGA